MQLRQSGLEKHKRRVTTSGYQAGQTQSASFELLAHPSSLGAKKRVTWYPLLIAPETTSNIGRSETLRVLTLNLSTDNLVVFFEIGYKAK